MTDDQAISEQTDLMQYVPKVHFEQIPIRNLVSNQEYQRNLSQNHVQRAAANFDLYQINPVKSAAVTASTMFLTDSTPLKSWHSSPVQERLLYGAWSMMTSFTNTKPIFFANQMKYVQTDLLFLQKASWPYRKEAESSPVPGSPMKPCNIRFLSRRIFFKICRSISRCCAVRKLLFF